MLQDTGMQSIAEEIGITTAQLSLAWLLSKRICVIPKSNNILRQKENFCPKDATYNVLHFSADMDKISEGKIPAPSYLKLLKNPRKTPTGCAGWSGMMMFSIYCGYLGSLSKVLALFKLSLVLIVNERSFL